MAGRRNKLFAKPVDKITEKQSWQEGISDPILRIRLTEGAEFGRPTYTWEVYRKAYGDVMYEHLTCPTSKLSDLTEKSEQHMRNTICIAFLGSLKFHMAYLNDELNKAQQLKVDEEGSSVRYDSDCSDIINDFENPQNDSVHVHKPPSINTTSTESDSDLEASDSDLHLKTTEENFLSRTLRMMKPTHASQPFWCYGFDVKVVKDMKSIYELEGVNMENFVSWENVVIHEDSVKIVEFLKRLCADRLESYPDEHFIKTVRLSVSDYKEKKDDLWIVEFVETYRKKSQAFDNFWFYTCEKPRDLKFLSEDELRNCVERLLTIDARCFQAETTLLKPFKYVGVNCIGQKCYPDSEYILETLSTHFGATKERIFQRAMIISLAIELKSSSFSKKCKRNIFMQTIYDSLGNGDTSVNIEIKLLWQVLEQCLGKMIKIPYEADGNTKVFQAGLIVVGNKVRNLVVSMDVHAFNSLCELNKAEDTIDWMWRTVIESGDLWCRLYVDCNELCITDIVRLARYTCTNFCKSL